MTWIRTIDPTDASGPLADLYERIIGTRGRLSNIMRVQSLAPGAMEHHLNLYMELLFSKGGLSRAERELLAVVVSVENRCEYCTLHHSEALRAWWKSTERVAALEKEGASMDDLSEREGALARYAELLTRSPSSVREADVAALRTASLGDEEILQANMIIAYFNFVNRIAEGLGVEAPPEEVSGYRS